jgi:signal transduction histidine kinase
MKRYLIYILILFTTFAKLTAEEKRYPYRFDKDTTLTGLVINEGKIFDNNNYAFVAIYNTFRYENKPSSIIFYDNNFKVIETIKLADNHSTFLRDILVFDFDGDSYDEVVFGINDGTKIWFMYFDPSNSPKIKEKILEIPYKNKYDNANVNMVPAQIESDKVYEMIVTFSEQSVRNFTIRGIWAVDLERKTKIWENYSAENLMKTDPINFFSDNFSYVVYASSARKTNIVKLSYSNNNYFYQNLNDNIYTTYNTNFERDPNAKIDLNSANFSTDSLSIIRAVNSKNELMWKRIIGGNEATVKIDSIRINKKQKILLTCTDKEKSILEIIDPLTGKVEKRTILKEKFYETFFYGDKIFAVEFKRGITQFNFNSVPVKSGQSKFRYAPLGYFAINDENLIIGTEGSSVVQSLIALNDNLEKVANFEQQGVSHFLPHFGFVSVFDSGKRVSKLFSLHKIEWYNNISVDTLRNLVISILLILVVTLILWLNTLRLSWKKIKSQKEELELTHNELKNTTAKLVEAEKLAVYGTIASSIAHEINSPLGAIINSAQRIRDSKNANIESNINLIEKAGKRAKSIVEKLLLGAQRNEENVKTNLNDVINEWKDLSGKQLENLGIKLNIAIVENPNLAISSTELSQIITNLFFNSRDSIMDNNSEIKVINLSASIVENNCEILIQDSGPGFTEAKLQKPFEAFVSTKEKGKGTGLGLWVIKNIIDNIGGKIKIGNNEIGAKVEIIIPLYSEKHVGQNG